MESDCTWENRHCVSLIESALPSSLPIPTFLSPNLERAKKLDPSITIAQIQRRSFKSPHTHTHTHWMTFSMSLQRGEVSMSPPVPIHSLSLLYTNCRVSVSCRHSIGHTVDTIDWSNNKRESLITARGKMNHSAKRFYFFNQFTFFLVTRRFCGFQIAKLILKG